MLSYFEFSAQLPLALIVIVAQTLRHLVFGLPENVTDVQAEESESILRQSLRGQYVVVTGANTGVGKRTAVKLALRGAHVIMACRDPSRGSAAAADARAELRSLSGGSSTGTAEFVRLDLGDLPSVAKFASNLKSRLPRLDILVNNAGLNVSGRTKHGLETLFQVNYLGHALLVHS